MSNVAAPDIPWSQIALICRRVCVLRERGLHVEADELQAGALADAVAAVQASGVAPEACEARVEKIFIHESDRVATAAVVAELLLPALLERLKAPAPSMSAPTPLPARSAVPRVVMTPPPRCGGASIADFIDAMIAQGEGAEGPAGNSPRRVP